MSYRVTSRYVGATIYEVPNSNPKTHQLDNRKYLKLDDFNNWDVVYWEQGDSLPIVAFNYYGDTGLWWVIADVNDIQFPLEIEEGTKIIIPDTQEVLNLVGL